MPNKFFHLASIALFSTAPLSSAQDAAASDTREVRILPIGQYPPTVIETIGKDDEGARLTREKSINPKFLPPSTLYSHQKGKEKAEAVTLTLNYMSRAINFPAKSELKLLTKAEGGKLVYHFKKADKPEQDHPQAAKHLLLLFPKKGRKDWIDYEKRILKDDWQSFPANSIRIINLSSLECGLALGDEKFIAEPGSVQTCAIPNTSSGAEYATFSLFARGKQGAFRLLSNAIMLNEPQRHTLIIYPKMFHIGDKPVLAQKITELPNR